MSERTVQTEIANMTIELVTVWGRPFNNRRQGGAVLYFPKNINLYFPLNEKRGNKQCLLDTPAG